MQDLKETNEKFDDLKRNEVFSKVLIRISVSVLALEEYNTLQQRYALETQCRVEAEKYAAEVGNLSDGVGVGGY